MVKKDTVIFKSGSEEKTIRFAALFARLLVPGDVIILSGDYGAGKTVFVRGLARGLKIKADVCSPSFTCQNVYGSGKIKLFHYDIYRLKKGFSPLSIGLESELFSGGITAIEWGDSVSRMFPGYYRVKIKHSGAAKREIRISKHFRGKRPDCI